MELSGGTEKRIPIQFSVMLEQLSDEFYPIFAEKQLKCRVDIQHHLVVLGDPDKLARVFDNVLRNAVNYSIPGGQVEIEARRQGDWAEITIRNEGLEIPRGSWPISSASSTGWTPPAQPHGRGGAGPGHRQGDCGAPRGLHPGGEQRAYDQLYHHPASVRGGAGGGVGGGRGERLYIGHKKGSAAEYLQRSPFYVGYYR